MQRVCKPAAMSPVVGLEPMSPIYVLAMDHTIQMAPKQTIGHHNLWLGHSFTHMVLLVGGRGETATTFHTLYYKSGEDIQNLTIHRLGKSKGCGLHHLSSLPFWQCQYISLTNPRFLQ